MTCNPNSCSKVECNEHMWHIVTPKMRKVPITKWPVQCQRALPEGPCTLDLIGALLGCTRERIRQIEVIALKKMRVAARNLV